MKPNEKVIFAALAVAVVVLGWAFRYIVVPTNASNGYIYVINRWTGEIAFIAGMNRRALVDVAPGQ